MAFERPLYAGVEFTSGRKPMTVAVLGNELDILALETGGIAGVMELLEEYERLSLAIHVPTSPAGREVYSEFRKKIGQAGFKPYQKREADLQWSETQPEECFRAFQRNLLPQRSLEGRIQRALILYEAGVQFSDPMDYYEEITRHKLLQGLLPAETIYSTKQLAALVAAYVAWLADHHPGEVVVSGDHLLPRGRVGEEENTEQLTYL